MPYPSVQDAGYNKLVFDFSDINFLNIVKDEELVGVDIKDPWIEAFVEINLKSNK